MVTINLGNDKFHLLNFIVTWIFFFRSNSKRGAESDGGSGTDHLSCQEPFTGITFSHQLLKLNYSFFLHLVMNSCKFSLINPEISVSKIPT